MRVFMRKCAADYRSSCPISIALDLFGDRWTLLVIRDLMFKGVDTFNGFMDAPEKIATNILSDRLARLEAAGILSKHPDAQDARRIRYRLTEKGMDLAPVLIEIILWSAAYEDTGAPPELIRQMRKDRAGFIEGLRKKWAALMR